MEIGYLISPNVQISNFKLKGNSWSILLGAWDFLSIFFTQKHKIADN